MTPFPKPAALRSVLGVATALLVFELCLRVFASPFAEHPRGRALEYRQYHEGIATSHFTSEGERRTGNPQIPGAPNVLILGDSHIDAVQVEVQHTVGSVLERRFRSQARPMNVHQFGWINGSGPTYAAIGPLLIKRWEPVWTVVVLNYGDLGLLATRGAIRMHVDAAGNPTLIDERREKSTEDYPYGPDEFQTFPRNVGKALFSHSVLAYSVYVAFRTIFPDASVGDPDEQPVPKFNRQEEKIPLATVRLLKDALGPRLLIVYDSFLVGTGTSEWGTGTHVDDLLEAAVLDACKLEGVHCVVTRERLIEDRLVHQRLSRGFSNTMAAHWNNVGHEIMAHAIWDAIAAKPVAGR